MITTFETKSVWLPLFSNTHSNISNCGYGARTQLRLRNQPEVANRFSSKCHFSSCSNYRLMHPASALTKAHSSEKRRKGGSKIKKKEEEKSKSENRWEDEGKDNKEEKEGRDEEATQIERHRFSGHVQLEFRIYRSLIAFTYMINCGLWHHHEPELDVGLIICLSLCALLRERFYQSILVALNSSPRSFQVLYFRAVEGIEDFCCAVLRGRPAFLVFAFVWFRCFGRGDIHVSVNETYIS